MNTGPFGYSDTSATVTVWLVVKNTPYTKYHRIELQSLGVTLFGRLNTVTVILKSDSGFFGNQRNFLQLDKSVVQFNKL